MFPVVNNDVEIRENKSRVLTGCPRQAKAIPPHVADTITTTRSDMNLRSNCSTGYFDFRFDMIKTLSWSEDWSNTELLVNKRLTSCPQLCACMYGAYAVNWQKIPNS